MPSTYTRKILRKIAQDIHKKGEKFPGYEDRIFFALCKAYSQGMAKKTRDLNKVLGPSKQTEW